MALHTSLNIYRSTYELLLVSVTYVGKMPRAFKPAFGKSLSELVIAMILRIRAANIASDKAPSLDVLLELLEEFNTLLRLFNDKHWISRDEYAGAIAIAQSVGKQATAWKKGGRHHAASPVT